MLSNPRSATRTTLYRTPRYNWHNKTNLARPPQRQNLTTVTVPQKCGTNSQSSAMRYGLAQWMQFTFKARGIALTTFLYRIVRISVACTSSSLHVLLHEFRRGDSTGVSRHLPTNPIAIAIFLFIRCWHAASQSALRRNVEGHGQIAKARFGPKRHDRGRIARFLLLLLLPSNVSTMHIQLLASALDFGLCPRRPPTRKQQIQWLFVTQGRKGHLGSANAATAFALHVESGHFIVVGRSKAKFLIGCHGLAQQFIVRVFRQFNLFKIVVKY